jgi:hypothetical protein
VRADAIDLDLFGHQVRVVVEDTRSREALASELREFIIPEPAITGLVMKLPNAESSFHVLLDRSGLVLGRTRSADECLGVLGRYLASFAPPPTNATRHRMRALVNSEGEAVLAVFPLFAHPPVVERRLEREGFRLIDRLAVDVQLDKFERPSLALPTWVPGVGTDGCPGHAGIVRTPIRIEAILVPDELTSRAMLVAELASSSLGGPVGTVLDRAELLSELPTRTVDVASKSSRYSALF